MVASIKSGVDPKSLVAEINSAQARREALESQLRLADQLDVTVLHPNAAASYRHKVVQLQEALARGDVAALEAVALVRGLVREIRITPAADKMELQVVGDLAALLEQEQGMNKGDFISGCGISGCGGSIWPRFAMPLLGWFLHGGLRSRERQGWRVQHCRDFNRPAIADPVGAEFAAVARQGSGQLAVLAAEASAARGNSGVCLG